MSTITESLNYLDMEGQMTSYLSIDEYAAKMGEDKDIITLTFTVKSESVGEDLVSWFERGYSFVLDASVSDGELEPGKYLVFVEMERRSWSAGNIIRLIEELQTLTGYALKDWTVNINGEDYPLELPLLKDLVILNPGEYKETVTDEVEDDLNEMRLAAGLDHKSSALVNKDTYIKDLQAAAGI